MFLCRTALKSVLKKKLYFVFASLDQKNIFLKEKKREKGPKSIKTKNMHKFLSHQTSTKNAKLEDTKRGERQQFSLISCTWWWWWYLISNSGKKVVDASCYITLCQILKWCTIFPLSENVWQIIWFYLLALENHANKYPSTISSKNRLK